MEEKKKKEKQPRRSKENGFSIQHHYHLIAMKLWTNLSFLSSNMVLIPISLNG
jgi:hypothetical protein